MTKKLFKGFTLIELLVVIAIIAILAAILFPAFAQAREKARGTTCLANVKNICTGLVVYMDDWDEYTPRCYGPNSGADVATFSSILTDGRPNGIGCLYSYVAGNAAWDNFYNIWKDPNGDGKKSNPGVLKCTSDKTYANAKWTCSYMCGPSPFPFWAGGTDWWGKEGEHVSEYKDLTQAAAIIESRQFFYWRGCNPKGHNMKTPCGFVDGHAKMYAVLRPRELYRDPNQGDDWVVGCGVGPCDAAGNNSWGETSQYWNPQVLYEYYWK